MNLPNQFQKDLKELDKINNKLNDLSFYGLFSFDRMGISISHAMKGVRVNGWASLVSVPRVVKDLEQMNRTLEEVESRLPGIREQIKKANEILSKYSLCPDCKGNQGWTDICRKGSHNQACVKCCEMGYIIKKL